MSSFFFQFILSLKYCKLKKNVNISISQIVSKDIFATQNIATGTFLNVSTSANDGVISPFREWFKSQENF